MSTAWVKPPATTKAASSTSLNLFPGPNKSMNNNNESAVVIQEVGIPIVGHFKPLPELHCSEVHIPQR